MNKNKIYTKRGDGGETGTLKGRMSKGNQIAIALGTVDELNTWIGVCYENTLFEEIKIDLNRIQNNLLIIGSGLAGSNKKIGKLETKFLEKRIDDMMLKLPELSNFIFPTGREVAAFMQVARTVARRAEREVVAIGEKEGVVVDKNILIFLNRLSDYLFTLARFVNLRLGGKEQVWK